MRKINKGLVYAGMDCANGQNILPITVFLTVRTWFFHTKKDFWELLSSKIAMSLWPFHVETFWCARSCQNVMSWPYSNWCLIDHFATKKFTRVFEEWLIVMKQFFTKWYFIGWMYLFFQYRLLAFSQPIW